MKIENLDKAVRLKNRIEYALGQLKNAEKLKDYNTSFYLSDYKDFSGVNVSIVCNEDGTDDMNIYTPVIDAMITSLNNHIDKLYEEVSKL